MNTLGVSSAYPKKDFPAVVRFCIGCAKAVVSLLLLEAAGVAAQNKQPPPPPPSRAMETRPAPNHSGTGRGGCTPSDTTRFARGGCGNSDGGKGPNSGGSPGATQPPDPTQVIVYHPSYGMPCNFGPVDSSGGASEARAALLDKDGPQLPRIFNMSSFSVMGFVKGSWPVVFDYQLEKDSLLIVVIAPEGQEPILYRLRGKAGHWQSRLKVPANVGGNPVVAQYVLQSLDDNMGQVSPAHLHVHGVAAGPKAVGSIGIDQVAFGPAMIHLNKNEKAHYMFHSISDFKNVEVNFVRIANDHGQIIAARIGKQGAGSIARNEQKNGDWDGKVDGGEDESSYPPEIQRWLKSATGQHLLQVRAWYGAKDGDWATALSENFVTVE